MIGKSGEFYRRSDIQVGIVEVLPIIVSKKQLQGRISRSYKLYCHNLNLNRWR